MNPRMISNDFDVFSNQPKNYATYSRMKRGDMISNGDHFGVVELAAFGVVLVNWQGINPQPLPAICYPKDVWNFEFGANYEIVPTTPAGEAQ